MTRARWQDKDVQLKRYMLTERHLASAEQFAQLQDSFRREVALLVQLEHPCVVKCFGCVVDKSLGPSSPKPASRSLRRALLMPQVNTGSLYRCGKRT